MQADLLKRLENTLGDCVIGPIRTLKTGDLADVLYDAHKEIERLRAREAQLREALEKIARYDMQAIAIDALHPRERIRSTEEEKGCPTNTIK